MKHKKMHKELISLLQKLEGKPYDYYQQLSGRFFIYDYFHLSFVHIQGSPGASPASVCQLYINIEKLGLEKNCCASKPREIATADYLLRAFHQAVNDHTRPNRGAQGSGSYQQLSLPPQVLQRNIVTFKKNEVHISFHVSLPGSSVNTILGKQACQMFSGEIGTIVNALITASCATTALKQHCDIVEDAMLVQSKLSNHDLIAFIADGSSLPRKSGISQEPMLENAIPFKAPEEMAVTLDFPNAGQVRGLGIRTGVTVLIGPGFHGKSTLLDTLTMCVYPHIPGDGREKVITHSDAVKVCAEQGRAIQSLNISGFFKDLPDGSDLERFATGNASGSTSQAAAIIESVLAGAKLLLIDEDTSAQNFLIQDEQMRNLLPDDTITPLFDRVRELYHDFGVSTLIAIGGSSDYLGLADQIIALNNYQPMSIKKQLQDLVLPKPIKPKTALKLCDERRLLAENFDPSYDVRRLGKRLSVRIKPLRLQEKILEYGNNQLDLTSLAALIDPSQTMALGYSLLLARKMVKESHFSPSQLANEICQSIAQKGLTIISEQSPVPLFLALPRKIELAGAMNRLRDLKVRVQQEKDKE